MKKSILLFVAILLLSSVLGSAFSLLISNPVLADVPQVLNVQGRLLDKDGKPVNGKQNALFSIVKPDNKGISVGNSDIEIRNGIFSVDLNIAPAITMIDSEQCRLRIFFTGLKSEFYQSLTSVPYAIKSANSDKLNGKDITNFVLQDPTTKNVVIGGDLKIIGGIKDKDGNPIGANGLTLSEASNNFVLKAGDTMAGTLKIGEYTNPKYGATYLQVEGKGGAIMGITNGDGYAAVRGENISENPAAKGILGISISGAGVMGFAKGNGNGIEAIGSSGYSGYFKGGKGVKIEGPLEVTGNITAPNVGAGASGDFVSKKGDTMTGVLSVEAGTYDTGFTVKGKNIGLKSTGGYIGGSFNSDIYEGWGVKGEGGQYGGYFTGDKIAGVYSKSTGGYGLKAESDSNYSGYFTGGKGVKVDGPLEVTGQIFADNITNPQNAWFVLRAGDTMKGKLTVNSADKYGSISGINTYASIMPGENAGVPSGVVTGYGIGVIGINGKSLNNFGVFGKGALGGGTFEGTAANGYGIYVTSVGTKQFPAIYGENKLTNFAYVAGEPNVGPGVYGKGPFIGIIGEGTAGGSTGIVGKGFNGVSGIASNGIGVSGASTNGIGVSGTSTSGIGVYGSSVAAGDANSPFKILYKTLVPTTYSDGTKGIDFWLNNYGNTIKNENIISITIMQFLNNPSGNANTNVVKEFKDWIVGPTGHLVVNGLDPNVNKVRMTVVYVP